MGRSREQKRMKQRHYPPRGQSFFFSLLQLKALYLPLITQNGISGAFCTSPHIQLFSHPCLTRAHKQTQGIVSCLVFLFGNEKK